MGFWSLLFLPCQHKCSVFSPPSPQNPSRSLLSRTTSLAGAVYGCFRHEEASSGEPMVWGVIGVRIVAGPRQTAVVEVMVGRFDQDRVRLVVCCRVVTDCNW
ncbi:hypothetical protein Droror1_Dr00004863 [Drosera rotundifolia]